MQKHRRLDPKGRDYATVLRWIDEGAPRSLAVEPTLDRIEMFPTSRRMVPREQQAVLVLAHDSDGSVVDVTGRSAFEEDHRDRPR